MPEIKPCVRLTLTNTKPSIFESKIGGIGYIPHDGSAPANSKGEQLQLLAQVDCTRVPLEAFPEKGLLQFWIAHEDCFGLGFDDQTVQEGFRVLYVPEIDRTVTEEEVRAKTHEFEDDGEFPVFGEFGLTFTMSQDVLADPDDENSEGNFGHKIGGFPDFTQGDPRDGGIEDGEESYDFLLLQIDSDYDGVTDNIMWGDSGICNFFISSEKLRRLDFSDIIYNWDCC